MQKEILDYSLNDFQPVALINLKAVENNAKAVKDYVKTSVCAVVKSDAYGHGLVECARALSGVADRFAVCSLEEAITLKQVGITAPILCLLPVKNVLKAIEYGVEFTIHTQKYLEQVNATALSVNNFAKVHIAINTGMNRLGFDCENQLKLLPTLKNLQICGVFSHFYNGANNLDCERQLAKFYPFVKKVKGLYPHAIAHIASSGSIHLGNRAFFDMIRVGIAIYGYDSGRTNLKLTPAMKVIAPSVQKRMVKKGENLLYGNYKMKSDERINVCAYGYANGFRTIGNDFFNNACMNLCAIGGQEDYVEIMSDAQLTANRLNTIEYDVLTKFGLNCKRIYYYGEQYENYIGKI